MNIGAKLEMKQRPCKLAIQHAALQSSKFIRYTNCKNSGTKTFTSRSFSPDKPGLSATVLFIFSIEKRIIFDAITAIEKNLIELFKTLNLKRLPKWTFYPSISRHWKWWIDMINIAEFGCWSLHRSHRRIQSALEIFFTDFFPT